MMLILLVVLAYLLGGIPFGYVLVRLTTGKDVRSMGSGNIGATNVLRTTGKAAGLATLFLDVAKGVLAVWLMDRVSNHSIEWMSAAAGAVILGHIFPVFLKFKGGKAVATFAGAFGYLTPIPLLATLILFVITLAFTRYVSAASVLGALCFPFGVFLISHPPIEVLAVAVVCGALVIWRHRSNLERIRSGTENVFSFGTRKR
jgi:acyl phosphate:glycerol-3-phosphate acyltransferase